MNSTKLAYPFYFFFLSLFLVACGSDEDGVNTPTNNFDRTAMLSHWADNIIIPSYESFSVETNALKIASDNFSNSPSQANLETLRAEFEDAYLSWQNVEMFDVGPAMDNAIRIFVNIYPTNTANVDDFILNENYNLNDPNLNDEQGFPALDYLLFGLAETDAEILQLYDNDFNGEKYTTYLSDVVNRIDVLANQVLEDWQNGYRDVFVDNNSSSANGSINRLANQYLKYYEVYFRNGKIGFPAGVFSGGNPDANRVEGLYSKDLSKALCLESLTAFQNFFNGNAFNSSESGESFKSYLDFLDTMKDGENLSTLINQQFEVSKTAITNLDDSFYHQINTNNTAMLLAFEELQDNVVLLKSDMFSALSLTLSFESGDGD